MNRIARCITAAALALAVSSAPALDTIYKKEEEKQLIATLQSAEAPQFDKVLACKKLAVIGSRDAIPALAALLTDEKLSHMARYGLEPMPDPAAGQALRDAAGKVKGRLLVGVLNSIGTRRDAQAFGLLTGLLGNADIEVAAAAAAALSRIGDEASAQALAKALPNAPADAKASFGDSGVRCVEELTAAGKGDAAAALADTVRKADLPGHIRLAATRGAILARGKGGVPLLLEQLKSPEWASFALGLRVARELKGEEVTKALVGALPTLPPDRQPDFLTALADRGDSVAIPAIVNAAKEGSPPTRVAAIGALGRIGDGTAVPVLMAAAASDAAGVPDAAKSALVTIRGKGAEEALIAQLGGDKAAKMTAIAALGDRYSAAAAPALAPLAGDSDDEIRGAAIAALGKCATPATLPTLTDILVAPKQPRDAGLADAALRAACSRLPQKDAVADKILAALPKAQGPAKAALLKLLSATGGKMALDALRNNLKDPDAAVQESALRALSEWSDPDAAPALLELAKSLPDEKQRILAFRGYIRLTDSNSITDEQKVAMCKDAMAAATRDEEKKLVLGALSNIATADAMQQILPLLDGALKEEAGAAIVAIADKLSGVWWKRNDPKPILESLEKVVATCQEKQTLARATAVLKKHGRAPGKAKAGKK